MTNVLERRRKRCRSASKYKAIRAPKCNGGEPCDYCRALWSKALANAQIMRNRQWDQVG